MVAGAVFIAFGVAMGAVGLLLASDRSPVFEAVVLFSALFPVGFGGFIFGLGASNRWLARAATVGGPVRLH
jgi:hypothetical protein